MDPITRNLNWGNILQDENCVFKAVTAALLEVKNGSGDNWPSPEDKMRKWFWFGSKVVYWKFIQMNWERHENQCDT